MKEQPKFIHDRKVAVIRPLDADLAIKNLREYQSKSFESPEAAKQEFDALVNKQTYLFVGYLSVHGKIIDEDNRVVERQPQVGDSFINADGLKDFAPSLKSNET